MKNVKFMWNGIKIEGTLIKGTLYGGSFYNGALYCFTSDSQYNAFEKSQLLKKYFKVENDTDAMADYFDNDSVYFFEGDECLNEIQDAINKGRIHYLKNAIKRIEQRLEKIKHFSDYQHRKEYLDKQKLEKIEELNKLLAA